MAKKNNANDTLGLSEWIGIAIATAIIIATIAIMSPSFRAFVADGATGQWAAAIATAAAVVVALWLGLRDGRQRREERLEMIEQGENYVASLKNRVAALIDLLEEIQRDLTIPGATVLDTDTLIGQLDLIIAEIASLDHAVIRIVDGNCAIRLMRALDQVHAAALYLGRPGREFPDQPAKLAVAAAIDDLIAASVKVQEHVVKNGWAE